MNLQNYDEPYAQEEHTIKNNDLLTVIYQVSNLTLLRSAQLAFYFKINIISWLYFNYFYAGSLNFNLCWSDPSEEGRS